MGTAIIAHRPQNDRFVRFCDFCGASADEVELLIASPNGNHICDICVGVCVDVVSKDRAKAKEPRP